MKAPSTAEQKSVVERAFAGYSNCSYQWLDEQGRIKKVKIAEFDGTNREICFAMRSVSGGGRPGSRPNELRVQLDPAVINELFEINKHGKTGLIIGVYCNESANALVLWRPLDGSTGSGSASKQIDASVVAQALVNGVSSCVYPDGEVVYAIKPELFRSYIDCLMPKEKKYENGQEVATIGGLHRNLIVFGAPGTGKSYQLNKEALGSDGVPGYFNAQNTMRVTFHPDYTYAQFVGCFKPYSRLVLGEDKPASAIKDAPSTIEYKFVPGPFIKTYTQAIKHPEENYLLIIEEINRANPAAVFGDIFQLLDRNAVGASEYPVNVSEELHDYLKIHVGPLLKDSAGNLFGAARFDDPEYIAATSTIALPPNMYIWATMNSADQGVFPMDTAFKRRWDFRYIGIDEGESVVEYAFVPLGETGNEVRWNDLRKGVNKVLLNAKVNEDKLLGPFFIDPAALNDKERFNEVFKSKVLLYLFEDAAKTKREKVFAESGITYSMLCLNYDAMGTEAFKGFEPIFERPIEADPVEEPAEEDVQD